MRPPFRYAAAALGAAAARSALKRAERLVGRGVEVARPCMKKRLLGQLLAGRKPKRVEAAGDS